MRGGGWEKAGRRGAEEGAARRGLQREEEGGGGRGLQRTKKFKLCLAFYMESSVEFLIRLGCGLGHSIEKFLGNVDLDLSLIQIQPLLMYM